MKVLIRLILIAAIIVSWPFSLLQALYYGLVWLFLGDNLFEKYEPLPFEIIKYYKTNMK